MFDSGNYSGIISTLLEAVDLFKTYLGQELKKLVDENVIEPIMVAKSKLFSSMMAAATLSIAAVFLAVAAFLLLADLVNSYPIACAIIGVIFFTIGLIFVKKAK